MESFEKKSKKKEVSVKRGVCPFKTDKIPNLKMHMKQKHTANKVKSEVAQSLMSILESSSPSEIQSMLPPPASTSAPPTTESASAPTTSAHREGCPPDFLGGHGQPYQVKESNLNEIISNNSNAVNICEVGGTADSGVTGEKGSSVVEDAEGVQLPSDECRDAVTEAGGTTISGEVGEKGSVPKDLEEVQVLDDELKDPETEVEGTANSGETEVKVSDADDLEEIEVIDDKSKHAVTDNEETDTTETVVDEADRSKIMIGPNDEWVTNTTGDLEKLKACENDPIRSSAQKMYNLCMYVVNAETGPNSKVTSRMRQQPQKTSILKNIQTYVFFKTLVWYQ